MAKTRMILKKREKKDKQCKIKRQIMNKEKVNNGGLSVANSVFGSGPPPPDVGSRAGALKILGIWLK